MAEALRTAFEHGKPELLGVLLVALHLQHGEPAPLPGTVGPRAH